MSKLDKQLFAKAKARGASNTEAALQAGAKTKTAAYKAGYRLSKDSNLQKLIDRAILRNDIDLAKLIRIYTDAAKATKTSIEKSSGEIYDSGIPDHATRMKAADKLLELSGTLTQLKLANPTSQNTNPQSNKELVKALQAGDEVELQRAVFRKVE